MEETLPEANPLEESKIITILEKLVKQYKKKMNLWRFFHAHYITISFGLFLLFLFLIFLYFICKGLITFEFSLIFSVVAFVFSFISLIPRVRGYPVDDLNVVKMKDGEDYYELSFSIQNCGHGKVKLDFAIYFIEEIESDNAMTSFLQCDFEKMDMYLEELVTRIKSGGIKVYALKAVTKYLGVFFTHNDIHTERRLHKFDKNKIYMITFLFRTSHKIFYYNSKYLKP